MIMKFIIIIIIVIYARPSLQLFLSKMHQSDGSFIMHYDGEVDVRLEKKREREREDIYYFLLLEEHIVL